MPDSSWPPHLSLGLLLLIRVRLGLLLLVRICLGLLPPARLLCNAVVDLSLAESHYLLTCQAQAFESKSGCPPSEGTWDWL